ncbi:MAG: PEP-CTERM sorting domain-containing protein [Phycisphaerales bacterium]
MKNVVFAVLAGVVSSASAQSVTLNIVASQSYFNTSGGAPITLSVFGSADFGTHIAGGAFSLSAQGGSGVIAGMTAAAADWGSFGENDRGDAGGGNHNGLVFGQLIAPPFFPPSEDSNFTGGEILLGTFVVYSVDGVPGPVVWTVGADPIGAFVLEIFDSADNSLTQVTAATYSSVSVGIPAPSALALLGLGGIVAARRNRR